MVKRISVVISHLIAGLMIMWIFVFPVSAQHNVINDSYDFRPTLKMALEKYYDLDHFKISMTIQDLDQRRTLGEGTLLANQIDGTFGMRMNYYIYNDVEDYSNFLTVPLEFIAYDGMQLAYVNYPMWLFTTLNHQDIVTGSDEIEKLSEILDEYKDVYLALNLNDADSAVDYSEFVNSLFLIPSEKGIDALDSEMLTYYRGHYAFNVQRIEIPEGMMQSSGQFHLGLDFDTKLQSILEEDNNTKWNLKTKSNYSFDGHTKGFNIGFSSSVHLSDIEQNHRYNPLRRDDVFSLPIHELYFDINLKKLITKPTLVDFYFHPRNQHLRLVLQGISEEVALNIFDSQTAAFETTHLRMTYEVEPTEDEVPKFGSFDRLSLEEWQYILNQAFKD